MGYSCNCLTFRGMSHTDDDKPCQDSSGVLRTEKYSIIAVADGHGNQVHFRSNAGSRIAIETVFHVFDSISSVEEKWNELKEHNPDILLEVKKLIISEWTTRIKNHSSGNPLSSEEKRISGVKTQSYARGFRITDYGTTLISCVVSDDFVIGIQIGDGLLMSLGESMELCSIFGTFDEYGGNLTESLCDENAADEMIVEYLDKDNHLPKALMICTDGYQNAFDNESLIRYSTSMIALCGIGGYWYSSIAQQVEMCTERGNRDDTSIAMAILDENNPDDLYRKMFGSEPKIGKDPDNGIPPKMVICTDGHQDEWDIAQYWDWISIYDEKLSGWLKNGTPGKVHNQSFEYEGGFQNYSRSGEGTEIGTNEVYNGEFHEGKRQGFGVITVNDKTIYEGSFENGMMNGFGRLYRGDFEYAGIFRNNLRHGLFKRGKVKKTLVKEDPKIRVRGNATKRMQQQNLKTSEKIEIVDEEYIFVVEGEQLQSRFTTEIIVWLDGFDSVSKAEEAIPKLLESIERRQYIEDVANFLEKNIHAKAGHKVNKNRNEKEEAITVGDLDLSDELQNTRNAFKSRQRSDVSLDEILPKFEMQLRSDKKKNVEDPTKASLDSTLWQVTKRTTSGGIVYQFRNKATNALLAFAAKENAPVVALCAKIESEIAELDEEDKALFLEDMGMHEAGLDRVIRAGYDLLGLQTYFTAGPKEVRAWTIHKGDTAPQAAGVIHTDFERGFIRAQTISFDDYISHHGEKGAQEAGKMRAEGKDYIVQDGDVMNFLFNV